MLVLTRRIGECIVINDNIKVRVVKVNGKQVQIGVEAHKDTAIHREEVHLKIQEIQKKVKAKK